MIHSQTRTHCERKREILSIQKQKVSESYNKQKYPKTVPNTVTQTKATATALGSLANTAMPLERDKTPPPINVCVIPATSDKTVALISLVLVRRSKNEDGEEPWCEP